MAIVSSYKVLDGTWSSVLQLVTTNEVICEFMLGCVRDCAVCDGDGAIGLDAIPISVDFSHCVGSDSLARV
jgi:hypothetical protein